MPQFVCCDCGEKPVYKEALKSHICINHLRWTPFECSYCSANGSHTWKATERDLLLHVNQVHPGKQVQCKFFPDSHKSQLLKYKVRQSKISTMQRNSNPMVPIRPTFAQVASAKRTKPEVIVIDEEEDSKPPSAPVVAHLSGDGQTAGAQSTNEFTHSTQQSHSVGENTGSMDNHLTGNSVVCQGAKTPGVECENKQQTEAPHLVNGPVEECNVQPKIYSDSEDDGDDFEPETPPSSIPESKQPEVGRQSHLSSSTTAEERRAKLEVMAGDDVDDDFVPFPPSPNTRSQQPDVGHSAANSKQGSSSRQRPSSPEGSERAKLKGKVKGKEGRKKKTHGNRRKYQKGYCVTCKRQYANPNHHLRFKHSSPVFECSHCIYRSKNKANMVRHTISGVCGRGAKVVRIRSKVDVAAEMRQLRETHLSPIRQALPYSCTQCKSDLSNVNYHILRRHLKVDDFECPVCGWSSYFRAMKIHIGERHPSCNIPMICSKTKYTAQIDQIRKASIIVKKK